MNTDEYMNGIRTELGRERATENRDGRAAVESRKPCIQLEHVYLSFDQPILVDLNMTVYLGETLLVLGESGSGKSTILKIILRLLSPDSGKVSIFGHEITHLSFEEVLEMRRKIGMVFQNAALFDSMSVYENIAYPLRENTELDEDEIEGVVREKLEFVDLDPDRDMSKLPAELSGGMRKRVGLARAIATDPRVVLYDEPTAGLDPLAVVTITELIKKLQQEKGVTSVLVTHDLRAAFRVASRVNLLHEGHIVFRGTPEEMFAANDPYVKAFLNAS